MGLLVDGVEQVGFLLLTKRVTAGSDLLTTTVDEDNSSGGECIPERKLRTGECMEFDHLLSSFDHHTSDRRASQLV